MHEGYGRDHQVHGGHLNPLPSQIDAHPSEPSRAVVVERNHAHFLLKQLLYAQTYNSPKQTLEV